MNKKGSIIVFALLFIVALSILGVVLFRLGYIGAIKPDDDRAIPGKIDQIVDSETKAIENVDNKTDDMDSIQKDLDNTNLSTLDQDVLGVKTAADGL